MSADGAPKSLSAAPAAILVDAAESRRACREFHKARPIVSARRTLHVTQALTIAALSWGLVTAFRKVPLATFAVLHASAFLWFAAMIAWRWLAAARLQPRLSRIAAPTEWPTYTILCPLYREAAIVGDLLTALDRIDYPQDSLDIKLLVETDDAATVDAALEGARTRPHVEVVALAPAAPRTKPKALNAGLARARGAYLTVFDAEDRPHPLQLRAAIAAFEDGGAELACVQAPLSIDNAGASWISRQFAAEYAIQFREILPLLAALKLPLPLGGSSNHLRTDVLRAVGGWDAYNVTEDAELGYRLARDGWRTSTIGPPTSEEAPATFPAWLRQRSRWIKGHLQTWLVLMRDPIRTRREMGWRAFASMQLVLGGGLIAAFAHGPIAFVILTAALTPYDLLGPVDFSLAVIGYCVAAFTALTASALTGNLSHARAALTMPLYWPLSSIAAACAIFELVFRPHYWSKTKHGLSSRAPLRD